MAEVDKKPAPLEINNDDQIVDGLGQKSLTGFASKVYKLVAQIPKGRVMTYGQIAALCGNPRAARIVGGIAHFGPEDLPWQRVVNRFGGLARGYTPGGIEAHKRDLEAEGVKVSKNYTVDVGKLIYWPKQYRYSELDPESNIRRS